VSDTTASSPGNRLDEAIAAYYLHIEQKIPFDREAFLAQYPEHYADLASFVDGIKAIEEIAHPTPNSNPTPREEAGQESEEARSVSNEYELLEELGRGGMGVVYKARQRKLNRLVAVKMILAGEFASPTDVQRFHREAEAVAGLDHPGIVPIYETGSHRGRHFFSMKLMEGGTLASRRTEYRHPRAAAAVVRTVALAVHHAHKHGILHRDLKPANILLDSDSNPHVTDFGLARPIGGGSDLTRSGAAVGTPNYMAPEQASGAARRVSTAADVYSLGAILYEVLTGAPPFQGESPYETVRLVTESEPAPPRSRNPAVPRDLNTICLKCLSKDPGKRYAGADALADDLGRWLTGEPIRARPVGRIERVYRWCRRNPAPALLSVALAVSIVAGLTIAGVQWQRAEGEAAVARAERDRANTERDAAQRERDTATRERQRAQAHLGRALEAIDFIGRQVGSVLLADVPRADKARREMIEFATRFIESFPESERNDPGVRRDKAMAYLRAGQFRVRLGESAAAIDALRKAIDLFDVLHRESPLDPTVAKGLIESWYKLAQTLADSGKESESGPAPVGNKAAWKEAEQALARAEELFRQTDPTIHTASEHELARAGLLEGRLGLSPRTGKFAEGEAAGQEAQAIYEQLLQESPGDHQLLSRLARLQGLRGWNLKAARRNKEARPLYESSLAHFASLLREAPNDPGLRAEAATARRNYAVFLRTTRDHAAARAEYQAAQQVLARLVDDFPDVPYYRSEWAESVYGEALVALNTGQLPKARPLLDRAVKLQREAFAAARDRADLRRRLVNVLMTAALAAIDDPDTDHAGAVNLLAELRPLAETGMDFSLAGQMLIACIRLVDPDQKLSADAKKKAVERYTAEFIALVQRARDMNHKEWVALLDNPGVREIPPHPDLTRLLEARKAAPAQ
jgi:tetratricopeptide (TPR) repeat protein/tRNA A-37 threonylcarbamoyl transferase component Bud32